MRAWWNRNTGNSGFNGAGGNSIPAAKGLLRDIDINLKTPVDGSVGTNSHVQKRYNPLKYQLVLYQLRFLG